jgi:hypothetical protein
MTGVPIVHKLGIPLATVSAALLPVLAEAAWRSGERAKGMLLVAPVIALLAFVLPAGVSRLGEAQQARVNTATTSAAEQARIRSDLARADKLVAQAQDWVASECRSGAGTKCKGVTYTLNQRQAYQRELSGKVETFTPVTTPWLPSWHPARRHHQGSLNLTPMTKAARRVTAGPLSWSPRDGAESFPIMAPRSGDEAATAHPAARRSPP